ncbi:MAG: hypothetical protein ACLGGX_04215 [Bdellovibrionia bacterium]
MRNCKWLLIFTVFVLNLVGCTSETKDMALNSAKQSYEEQLARELQEYMPLQHPLFGSWVHFVMTSSEFEVEDVSEVNEGMQMIQVKISTIPLKQRKVLADVSAKQNEEYKAKRFNIGSALSLIEQQPGHEKGKEEIRKIIRLRKIGGKWKTEEVSASP